MNLAQLLARQARAAPDRATVFDGPRPWASHAGWAARSAGLAQRLRGAGLQPGDRVLLFMRNHPRYLEILWAAWWAGLVVVPVNAKLHPAEAGWIAGDAGARWGFVTADVAPGPLPGLERQVDVESGEADALLAPAPDWTAVPIAERAPADLAWLFYTSGTTGRPKGVMLTHRNLVTMGLAYFADVDPATPDDAMAYAAPMSHGCGLYAIPHLMAGARHVVPASAGSTPPSCSSWAARSGRSAPLPRPPSCGGWWSTASAPGWARPRPRPPSRPSSTAARRCTGPTSSARWP